MTTNQVAKPSDRSRVERLAKSIVLATAIATASLLACGVGAQQSAVTREPVFVYEVIEAGRIGDLYRVAVYEDGEVVYVGRHNVKTRGEIRFTVEPQRVKEFKKAVEGIGFSTFAPEPVRPNTPGALVFVSLKEPAGTRSFKFKSLTRIDARFEVRVFDLMEAYFPTENLRCPYVVPAPSPFEGADICAARKMEFERIRSESP